jgi:hypothetical protein
VEKMPQELHKLRKVILQNGKEALRGLPEAEGSSGIISHQA